MSILKQTIFLLFACMALAIFLLACAKETNSPKNKDEKVSNVNSLEFDRDEFERKRALWESKNLTTYEMVMEARNSSNIAKRVVIKVENGKAKSATKVDPSDIGAAEQYKPYDTIEKIFEIVDRESKFKHDVLTVMYDPILGYPKSLISDQSTTMADEEFAIHILDLKAKDKD